MLGLERHPVRCLLDRQRRMPSQQIDHHAGMGRIEMLDQNEGHAGAAREHGEQPAEGIKAASRSAEPDDREIISRTRRDHAAAMNAGSGVSEPLRPVADSVLS